jgi:hypothetical protein
MFQIYLMHLFSLPFPAIKNVSSATCPPTFSYFIFSIPGISNTLWFTLPHLPPSVNPSIHPPSRRRAAIALLRDGRGASLRPALPRIPTAANIEAQLSPVHATQSHLRSDQPRRSTSSRGSCMNCYYYLLSFIRLVRGKREQKENNTQNEPVRFFISLNISQVQRPSRNKKLPHFPFSCWTCCCYYNSLSSFLSFLTCRKTVSCQWSNCAKRLSFRATT